MALFNMIFARHHGGQFLLRIEDTDRTRSRPEYEENIYKALAWAGIEWDEGPDVGGPHGPYRQSERTEIYRKHCQDLLDAGKAYKCFATAQELAEMREVAKKTGGRIGYDRRYRNLSDAEIKDREEAGEPYVIRLKVPLTGECEFHDVIKGRITAPWADIDDQILMKSDGFPTYHLANVVDDHLMGITHVIRGDEWISSTPKHILLYEAFEWAKPEFLHLPLLLGKDGKKLSKRKNPTSVFFYRDSGYLKEAFINFLTLMGYSMPGDQEIYTLEDAIKNFDVTRIGKSGAIFDIQKLDWLNQQYMINSIPEEKLWQRIKEWNFTDEKMERLIPLCRTRIKTFGEFMELFYFLFVNKVTLNDELLLKEKVGEGAALIYQGMIAHMDENDGWNGPGFEAASREIARLFGVNHKKVVMRLLFAAITGNHFGPPLFDSFDILGKDRARARLLAGIEAVGGISNKKMQAFLKAWTAEDCSCLLAPPGSPK
ncbi:MAG: Glutamate--tRNA ligase [Chlamydiia bacterium]|nr:Glutamate--tRNA ligase [Chlamydiia bacterium]MCH9616500.1 Glutamate--tRNA ligase [Chlamydiia bacterium]MCH9629514.1 Glutamate--tRNA ligase [Chlamydiia bacterium]